MSIIVSGPLLCSGSLIVSGLDGPGYVYLFEGYVLRMRRGCFMLLAVPDGAVRGSQSLEGVTLVV